MQVPRHQTCDQWPLHLRWIRVRSMVLPNFTHARPCWRKKQVWGKAHRRQQLRHDLVRSRVSLLCLLLWRWRRVRRLGRLRVPPCAGITCNTSATTKGGNMNERHSAPLRLLWPDHWLFRGRFCHWRLLSAPVGFGPFCLSLLLPADNEGHTKTCTCERHAEGGDLCGRCPAFCLPRMR